MCMKENAVQQKSFQFAIKSIELYKLLLQRNEFVLSKQFLRSATSIGANIEEALAAYSKREFASKMSIASKEARETMYWLKLLEIGEFIIYDYKIIKDNCSELIKLLTAIVKTSQIN